MVVGSLGICLVVSEDTGTEGLSSTSLVDFTTMSLLESPDSNEKTNLEVPEPHLFPSALQVLLGSGFASEEENEDFKILQSKIFWEDRSDNDSSLYLGPASGSPLSRFCFGAFLVEESPFYHLDITLAKKKMGLIFNCFLASMSDLSPMGYK